MEKSHSWETNNSGSSSQEILRFLWIPASLRVHKSPPLVLNLIQFKSVPIFTPCFFNTIFNILLPTANPHLPNSLCPFRFCDGETVLCISHLSHASYMFNPYHPPCSDCTSNIWWNVQIMKLVMIMYVLSRPSSPLYNPLFTHSQSVFFL
jgi:hypothetical protein